MNTLQASRNGEQVDTPPTIFELAAELGEKLVLAAEGKRHSRSPLRVHRSSTTTRGFGLGLKHVSPVVLSGFVVARKAESNRGKEGMPLFHSKDLVLSPIVQPKGKNAPLINNLWVVEHNLNPGRINAEGGIATPATGEAEIVKYGDPEELVTREHFSESRHLAAFSIEQAAPYVRVVPVVERGLRELAAFEKIQLDR